MTMAQRGKAVKTSVRKFKINDLDQVLGMVEKYASWDATATKADIEEFYSSSPEFFFVAEADKKILGFVCGRESNPPPKRSTNGNLERWRQLRRSLSTKITGDMESPRRYCQHCSRRSNRKR